MCAMCGGVAAMVSATAFPTSAGHPNSSAHSVANAAAAAPPSRGRGKHQPSMSTTTNVICRASLPTSQSRCCSGSSRTYSPARLTHRTTTIAVAAGHDRHNISVGFSFYSCSCNSFASTSAQCAAAPAGISASGREDDDDDGVRPDDNHSSFDLIRSRLMATLVPDFRPAPLSRLGHDTVGGWALGLAMAFLMAVGQQAPESHAAAMRDPPAGVAGRVSRGYSPVSAAEREASSAFAKRVSEALELLDKAKQAQARDDFPEALRYYSLITEKDSDLALAEYARVGRAVALYEVGDRAEAILEMEDMSLSLKGYPEVHAALAAALYADKHATVPAEQQFTFATLLDPRYTDPSWVKTAKHWPPSLIASLQKFIALR